jgi:hypothetical protein
LTLATPTDKIGFGAQASDLMRCNCIQALLPS